MSDENKRKDRVFCNAPFRSLMINAKGDCYFCGYSVRDYLDTNLGNILKVENVINDIWNGEKAQKIRKAVLNNSFECCNPECGNLLAVNGRVSRVDNLKDDWEDTMTQGINQKERKIIKTENVVLDYMPTDIVLSATKCNLKCPTCRSNYITNEEITEEQNQEILNKRLPLMKMAKLLILGYTGEVTMNSNNVKLLHTATEKEMPNLENIVIQSNGVYFTKELYDNITDYMKKRIGRIEFSMDAATPETYAINRPGGNWDKLWENIEYVASVKTFDFILNFVVQENNYLEMVPLVKKACELGVKVNFQQIYNWGTFSDEEFKNVNVFDPENEHHTEFLKIVKENILDNENIWLRFSESIIEDAIKI